MRSVMAFVFVSLVMALNSCAPEGSSAYVTFNIPPKSTCEVTPDSDKFLPIGIYDIGTAGNKSDFCKHSYFMHLVVTSNLKANARDSTGRAEPNVLQISGAVVRLMDKDERELSFEDDSGAADPLRPNPFRVRTSNTLAPATGTTPSTGVVAVEAIPKSYADKLTKFSGDSILAEVQVEGTTTGDVDIDFKPFVYPIQICRGCLTLCKSKLPDDVDPSTIYGDECKDNAAADGRYCIDPNIDCS
jgi:hypothetical protein